MMPERTSTQKNLIKDAALRLAKLKGVEDAQRSGLTSLGEKALQGVSFGTADEILAAGGAALGRDTLNDTWFDYSQPFDYRYDTLRARDNAQLKETDNLHPKKALISEMAGAVVPAILSKGKSAPLSMAQLGLRGGIAGGIYGGAASEESMERRIPGAVSGGIFGIGAGAAVKPIEKGVSYGVDKFRTWLGKLAPGQMQAAREWIATMRRAGKTTDEIADELNKAEQSGQPMMAADTLGIEGQNLISNQVARNTGRVSETAPMQMQKELGARQDYQRERVANIVEDVLGKNEQTAKQTTKDLKKIRQETSDDAYLAARESAKRVNVKPVVKWIDENIGKFIGAEGKLDDTGKVLKKYRNKLLYKRPEGKVYINKYENILNMKKELGDKITSLKKNKKDKQVNSLMPLLKGLDKSLEESSKAYVRARNAYAADSNVIDAIKKGQDAMSPINRYKDFADTFNKLSPDKTPNLQMSEQEAFGVGASDRIMRNIEKAAPEADVAKQFYTDTGEQKLRTLARGNANDALDRISREQAMFDTYKTMKGFKPGGIGDVVNTPPSTRMEAARRLHDHVTRKSNDDYKRELVDLLMQRGATAEQALRRADQLASFDNNMRRWTQRLVFGPAVVSAIKGN